MKQQGVHPEGGSGTPDAGARPQTGRTTGEDDQDARGEPRPAATERTEAERTEGAHIPQNPPADRGPGGDDAPRADQE
ncbi:hypothetical protein, partial [Streptomyces misionensis]